MWYLFSNLPFFHDVVSLFEPTRFRFCLSFLRSIKCLVQNRQGCGIPEQTRHCHTSGLQRRKKNYQALFTIGSLVTEFLQRMTERRERIALVSPIATALLGKRLDKRLTCPVDTGHHHRQTDKLRLNTTTAL